MIAAPREVPRKIPPAQIKLEEACNEIHDYLVLSHWKHS
jgi:hypothetical protein